jgi:hypothetical protein
MKRPPYLLKMSIQNHRHNFKIWLPLFLIWPIVLAFLLAIFLVLIPFALLSILFTWQPDWLRWVLRVVPTMLRLFAHLSGLLIDADRSQRHAHIEFV